MTPRANPRAVLTAMTASVRPTLAQLGSAAALSFPVAAIYAPIGIIVQAPGNATIYGGSRGLWLLASAIGMVSLIAIFGVARHRTSRRPDPTPLAVLVWYGLATIAQALTFGVASVLLGATDSLHLGFRLMGILYQVPLVAAVGYAVARHYAHHRLIVELQQTRERLLTIGRTLDSELERVEADLTIAVRETLDPAVESLDAALTEAEAGGDKAEVIGALDALVEQRVRPLAQELASETESIVELDESLDRPRARVPLPRRFPPARAIRPTVAALFLFVALLPSAVRALEPGELLLLLPAFPLVMWLLLTSANKALGSFRVPTILGVPLVACLYGAAGSAAFWLVGAIGITRPTGIEVAVLAFFVLLGLAITFELLVEARRELSEAELEAEAFNLQEALALIRRREHLVRRRLAFVIHGALQGALNAAALQIAEAGTVTAQLGQEIRSEIGAALSKVEGPRTSWGPLRTSTMVNELSSVWAGHRRFGARLWPAAEEALSVDPEADEAVAEVIREAANNAFRHGAAGRVEVEVGVTGIEDSSSKFPEEIAITVRDDGSGPTGSDQPGFGSSLFDDLCRTWALETEGQWTVFAARVTLNNQREPTGLLSGMGRRPSDKTISASGPA